MFYGEVPFKNCSLYELLLALSYKKRPKITDLRFMENGLDTVITPNAKYNHAGDF